jgi:TolB protein
MLLYLVSPAGTRYEVTYFAGGAGKPQRITDVRPDGRFAIVERPNSLSPSTSWYYRVDLATGVAVGVYSASYPESSHAISYHVQFTRPTGEHLVVYRNDGTKQWLERRTYPGSVLAVLYSESVIGGSQDLRWLYGQTGTTVLVKHLGGIAYVSNTGTLIREVQIPTGRDCDPVKWWDADTFLAACRGHPPLYPHDHYNQLWLLETNGGAGVPLTVIPSGPIDVVDSGYTSAHRLGGSATLLQWRGDCGTAQVRQLQPDGSGKAVTWPWLAGAHGYEITAVSGSQMGIYQWKTCDEEWGSLALSTTTGTFVRQLVPLTGDALGVISVLPIGP